MNFLLVEITDIWYIISSNTNRRWSLSCCTCSRWYSICCRWKWWYTFIKRQTSIGVIEKEEEGTFYLFLFNSQFLYICILLILILNKIHSPSYKFNFKVMFPFIVQFIFSFAHLSYTYVCRKYIYSGCEGILFIICLITSFLYENMDGFRLV